MHASYQAHARVRVRARRFRVLVLAPLKVKSVRVASVASWPLRMSWYMYEYSVQLYSIVYSYIPTIIGVGHMSAVRA